jgi:hypothetical protein
MVIIFVSPFLRQDVPLFVDRLGRLPGARIGLISHLPDEALPGPVHDAIAGYWRVGSLYDPEEILLAARGLSRHLGPIHRIFTEYELIQLPVAQAREWLGVKGASPWSVQGFRDKATMKDRFKAAGVPCARHQRVHSDEEAYGFAASTGYPLIVKPVAGVGTQQTYLARDSGELARALSGNPPHPAQALILEEVIEGDEFSLDSISLHGQPLWHSVTRYLPSPLEVMRNPWIQWRILTPREVDGPVYDDIRQVGSRALQALGMDTGISHMEWFRRSDGSIAISEVAARPPGSRIFTALNWANDFDMYRGWVELMAMERFSPPAERKYAVGTAFLRGMGRGFVTGVPGLDRVLKRFRGMIVEASLPAAGQPKGETYDGEGYLMLRHPETQAVEEALWEIVTTVRVEIGFWT